MTHKLSHFLNQQYSVLVCPCLLELNNNSIISSTRKYTASFKTSKAKGNMTFKSYCSFDIGNIPFRTVFITQSNRQNETFFEDG